MAGVCAAVTAARAGIQVVLVQDRPVLGGNASSEIRMVISGASGSRGNNNRWAREGGLIDELLVENAYRNPDGNSLIFDALLLEIVDREPNVKLLLNTAVYDCDVTASQKALPKECGSNVHQITAVRAFCSQNQTRYELRAPLFCDASGDGVLGHLSGAAYRVGAESSDEFDERFAPDASEYGELMGHTIYFQSKDTGRPVEFICPKFAIQDITTVPRWRRIDAATQGCQYWWVEHGGRLDTVHDTETIKWELWRIVYGIWNHIKNSGQFPETKTWTLEWVGTVPGKRESRRFEGPYMLSQRDVIERRQHEDTVHYGGWSLDLHPADGIYAKRPPCDQWHAKGIYPIPFRALYSRNVENLFLAGRIISVSHVAFGSTRVMATCAQGGQVVGQAAALCTRAARELGRPLLPWEVTDDPARLNQLKLELTRSGQHIPGYQRVDPEDLAQEARVEADSRLMLTGLQPDGPTRPLDVPQAVLLPVQQENRFERITFFADVEQPTELRCTLRTPDRPGSFTPETMLAEQTVSLAPGIGQEVTFEFDAEVEEDGYLFVCVDANPSVGLRTSTQLVPGVLSLFNAGKNEVNAGGEQIPPPGPDGKGLGVERFSFWLARPRPEGNNLAFRIEPALDAFTPTMAVNGLTRPTDRSNTWAAALEAEHATLTLTWPEAVRISRLVLTFDTDRDSPLYSVLYGTGGPIMPLCVRHFTIRDGATQETIAACEENHQTRCEVWLDRPCETDRLEIQLERPGSNVPAALVEVMVF